MKFLFREEKTNYQDGRLYLTNLRLIYIGKELDEQKKALSLQLKHVRSIETPSGFITTFPQIKVYLFPKDHKPIEESRTSKWICDRCTYHNLLNFNTCEMCNTSRMPGSKLLLLSERYRTPSSPSLTHIEHIYLKFVFKSGEHVSFFKRFQSVLERKTWQV
jgi:hypothetical protein